MMKLLAFENGGYYSTFTAAFKGSTYDTSCRKHGVCSTVLKTCDLTKTIKVEGPADGLTRMSRAGWQVLESRDS